MQRCGVILRFGLLKVMGSGEGISLLPGKIFGVSLSVNGIFIVQF